MVLASGSTLMDLPGVGPVVAARTLADVGDVARFADRNRFRVMDRDRPIEASSAEIVRHRLSRAGNRRMNHVIHIAAVSQIRLDTPGRAYYRRKLAAEKTRAEAMRCPKRRISDAIYRQLLADAKVQGAEGGGRGSGRALRGVTQLQRGRLAPTHGRRARHRGVVRGPDGGRDHSRSRAPSVVGRR